MQFSFQVFMTSLSSASKAMLDGQQVILIYVCNSAIRVIFKTIIIMITANWKDGQQTSQVPQPTCPWKWHPDTYQLGNPTTIPLIWPAVDQCILSTQNSKWFSRCFLPGGGGAGGGGVQWRPAGLLHQQAICLKYMSGLHFHHQFKISYTNRQSTS